MAMQTTGNATNSDRNRNAANNRVRTAGCSQA